MSADNLDQLRRQVAAQTRGRRMTAVTLVRVECPRCGQTAGILDGSKAWCWGSDLNTRHPARVMRPAR